jgi:signal transduction histidine kinase
MSEGSFWLSVLTCAALLALALLGVLRKNRSALATPLLLLCLNLLIWNSASLAYDVTSIPVFRWLDVSTSPLTAPLALDFTLAYVGLRRRLRNVRIAVFATMGALSLATALAFVLPSAREFAGSRTWAALHLAGILAAMTLAVFLLARHLRSTMEPVERARSRLLLTAIAVGGFGGASEVANNLYPWIPALGSLCLLGAAVLIALVALRLKLFDDELSLDTAAAAVVLACLSVAAQVAALRLLGASSVALSAGTAAVALGAVALVRRFAVDGAERRARIAQLVNLGRFSAQMAHDLKNPLAALHGAVQVLEVEQPQQRELLALMLAQVRRLEEMVERYRRLSHVEPLRAPLSLNHVVRETALLQPYAAGGRISLKTQLADDLPVCDADKDLIATALENLIRNSIEAMPEGGEIIVRTAKADGSVLMSVEDTGPGMDARTRERAFDDFFTTKASGSGLGLAFVRRVAEAHGGNAWLGERAGHGTIVNLRFPVAAGRQEPSP